MKKVAFPAAALVLSTLCLANLDGALPENTNAPGEFTCGRAPCHNIPVNAGDAQIAITFNSGDSTWMKDSLYPVTVMIQNPMTTRNGFQIVALNQNNQNAGTWQLTEPDKMKVIPGIGFPNRRYVTHQAAGNQQTAWTMRWKAPAAGAGKITFYASVLSANDNGLNTGDAVYSTKKEVQFAAVSAAGEPAGAEVRVYPVPAREGIWVEIPEAGAVQFTLYTPEGRLVKQWPLQNGQVHWLDTGEFAVGGYLLAVEAENRRMVSKVVVQ